MLYRRGSHWCGEMLWQLGGWARDDMRKRSEGTKDSCLAEKFCADCLMEGVEQGDLMGLLEDAQVIIV